jgi:hypothetical protein
MWRGPFRRILQISIHGLTTSRCYIESAVTAALVSKFLAATGLYEASVLRGRFQQANVESELRRSPSHFGCTSVCSVGL